jgi:CubicO group peptidase (beta-lactamase class C family)
MLSGRHESGFEPLARAFADVLAHKPFGGGALTLYLEGQPVFDMWGGPRDNEGQSWTEHTTSVSFSTAKGVAATALHICRDRGLVQYDEPVARYWPEFAQNDKGRITLRHVLSHGAGLYDAFHLIEHVDDLLDWDKTVAALAKGAPAHEAGRFHAYHALTFGHLVGEIVQRVTQRPFSRFIQDEIATPLGLSQFFMGAPESALPHAAKIYRAQKEARPARVEGNGARGESEQRSKRRAVRMRNIARVLRAVGIPMKPERMRDAFAIRGIMNWDFGSPEVMRACIPSLSGLFSARDLARMYATLASGGTLDGVRLLGADTLRLATTVQSRKPDGVLVAPVGWRLGYHGVFSKFGPVRGAYGHAGYNGSGAWASPRHNAALGYVVNAGSGTPIGDFRMIKLTSAALGCIRALRKRSRRAV